MPLSCDCYKGCWADHSEDWPAIVISKDVIEKLGKLSVAAAGYALVERARVPYGSYVHVGQMLRVETEDQKNAVLTELALAGIKL